MPCNYTHLSPPPPPNQISNPYTLLTLAHLVPRGWERLGRPITQEILKSPVGAVTEHPGGLRGSIRDTLCLSLITQSSLGRWPAWKLRAQKV